MFFIFLAIQNISEDFWETFYREHYRSALSYVKSRLIDKNKCEDAIQLSLLKLFRLKNKWLNLEENPRKAYIFKTLSSTCKDFNKEASLKHEVFLDNDDGSHEFSVEIAVEDHARLSVDQIYASELLSTLSPMQKSVLKMRYFEDRSYADIAAALGITENNARVHCKRAMDALRGRVFSKEEE